MKGRVIKTYIIHLTARGSDGHKIHQNFHNNDLFSSQDGQKMDI
jgi:hypothetical protein